MRALVLSLALVLSGCQAGYYWHLARGQLSLVNDQQPLEAVLADSSVSDTERERLKQARAILAFAEEELSLPVEDSYSDYVPLERDWVVWNLFAAPEFSLQPRQWCYPVAGCVNYRGYFDRERAGQQGRELRDQGLDVYGAGATAYSTLGWFEDPLTTPMLERGPAALAELLFHELTHRWLYVAGDTRFNESLATALAAEATRRWLARSADAEQGRAWLARERASRRVTARVRRTRDELNELYSRDLGAETLRARKQDHQQALREWYREASDDDPALQAWQSWFRGPLNNAQLNTVLDYNDYVPAFNRLLLDCGGHWACFRERVRELAQMDASARRQALERLND